MKGRLVKVKNGYNYIKEIGTFSLFIGASYLFNSKIIIISYNHKQLLNYHRIDKHRSLKVYGKQLLSF